MSKKIFIAEDEEVLREIYSARFENAGFSVSKFQNGLDLLNAVADQTPDIVLLDIMMPEMDGEEVLRTLHQNFSEEGKQHIPIIIWSNLSDDGTIRKFLNLGASHYLKKVEYSGDDLVQKVSEIVTGLHSV